MVSMLGHRGMSRETEGWVRGTCLPIAKSGLFRSSRPPMKVSALLPLCLFSFTLHASELKVVDEAEQTRQTKAGFLYIWTQKTYYRDNKKIASVVTGTQQLKLGAVMKLPPGVPAPPGMSDPPPQPMHYVYFEVGPTSWVSFNFDENRFFHSSSDIPMRVRTSADSVVVSAPTVGYCEIFYFKDGGFFDDGEMRKAMQETLREHTEIDNPH